VGVYGSGLDIRLQVEEQSSSSFYGRLEYKNGTVTRVEGAIPSRGSYGDAIWTQIGGGVPDLDRLPVTFKETGYLRRDGGETNLDGEYLAYVSPTSMQGAWFGSGVGLLGVFKLERERR
jgi:hypothetical protein